METKQKERNYRWAFLFRGTESMINLNFIKPKNSASDFKIGDLKKHRLIFKNSVTEVYRPSA